MALLDLGSRVDGVVDGDHFFRQAHVAANIDLLLRDGFFSWPAAWNVDMPLRLYDFPVYQAVVAGLALVLGTPAATTGEAVNVIAFASTWLTLAWLLGRLALPAMATTLALACFSASPIVRFYFTTVHTDPFLVALSTWSLAGFVAWQTNRAGRRAGLALWLGAGFVVTLAKSPIYLPVALVITAHRLSTQGTAGVWRRDFLSFVGVLLAALLLYRFTYTAANGTPAGGSTGEWSWYFGSLQERCSWESYDTVFGRLAKQALPLAALPGLLMVWFLDPVYRPGQRFVLAWALAATATCLLFLHVNVVHNYYQLPASPALAAAAALGLATLAECRRRHVGFALLGAICLGILFTSQSRLRRIAAPQTAALRASGTFLQEHTTARDFVLYLREEVDAHPAPHYFAQRHGVGISSVPPDPGQLAGWLEQGRAQDGRLYCFVPAALADTATALVVAWPLAAVAACGRLYEVRQ